MMKNKNGQTTSMVRPFYQLYNLPKQTILLHRQALCTAQFWRHFYLFG